MNIRKKANLRKRKLRHYAYGCNAVKRCIKKENIRFSKYGILIIRASEAAVSAVCIHDKYHDYKYLHADFCPKKSTFCTKISRLFGEKPL